MRAGGRRRDGAAAVGAGAQAGVMVRLPRQPGQPRTLPGSHPHGSQLGSGGPRRLTRGGLRPTTDPSDLGVLTQKAGFC